MFARISAATKSRTESRTSRFSSLRLKSITLALRGAPGGVGPTSSHAERRAARQWATRERPMRQRAPPQGASQRPAAGPDRPAIGATFGPPAPGPRPIYSAKVRRSPPERRGPAGDVPEDPPMDTVTAPAASGLNSAASSLNSAVFGLDLAALAAANLTPAVSYTDLTLPT